MKSYSHSEVNKELIVCPYCGKEYTPSFEDTYIGGVRVTCYKEMLQEFTCDNCHKRFRLYSTMTWDYETRTIDGEMSVIEHDQISGEVNNK